MIELYGTNDTDTISDVESLVEEQNYKTQVTTIIKIENSVCQSQMMILLRKFYAVFYSTRIKSYYRGEITKTFEYDENECFIS